MFFVAGLPRSRTAWFAAFMTASGHECLHEAIDGCKDITEYKAKVSSVSDSTTAFGLVDIPFNRPTLVIHRPGRHGAEYDKFQCKLDGIDGLHVNFCDIDHRISEIFKYLTGEQIDLNIFNLFKNLRIETLVTYNEESIKSLIKHNTVEGI